MVDHRLLKRMQFAVGSGDAFDGLDLGAVRLRRQHQAASRRPAIDQNRASAAHAVLAAKMGPGQLEPMPEKIRKHQAARHLGLMRLAVHLNLDVVFAHEDAFPTARSTARANDRDAMTFASCWRYFAEACASDIASSRPQSAAACSRSSRR